MGLFCKTGLLRRKSLKLLKKRKNWHLEHLAQELNMEQLPEHVAMIMDGNGRWAKAKGLPRSAGHRAGVENVRTVIRMSSDLGIRVLTLYAFSTENWKRPKDEVNVLMDLLVEYVKKELEELHRKNVCIRTLGNLQGMPENVAKAIGGAVEKTRNNSGLIVYFALNYGSRAELAEAAKKIAQSVKEGNLTVEEITEQTISDCLGTGGVPDPDLIIRTSGENRLSNFMLYQAAYSEFIFTKTLWPDFDEAAYLKTLIEYQHRTRRFGAV